MFSIRLQRAGLKVEEAGDGTSALKIAKDQYPDIVFVDYHLPDMTGSDLIQQMRTHDDGSVSYVIISGRDIEDIEQEAKSSGAALVARKPVSQERLEYILKKFCSSAKLI